MAFEKYFTADEANTLVPELLEIVPLIQKFFRQLRYDFPDVELARKAISENVARPLDMADVEAAYGIHTLVNSNMGRALRATRRHSLPAGQYPGRKRHPEVALRGTSHTSRV